MGKKSKKKTSFWLEVLSDSPAGTLSSKRVIGAFVLLICMGCIVYLVITEGGTSVVEGLIQTSLIMAGALLGISSITRIWSDKGNNTTNNGKSHGSCN